MGNIPEWQVRPHMAGSTLFCAAPAGLFVFEGTLCVKTEYYTDGRADAYILSSGEYFRGGTTTPREVNKLKVTPLIAIRDKGATDGK